MTTTPYARSPVFDEDTLPDALRGEHRTKPGTWGLLRVLSGEVHLLFSGDNTPVHVTVGHPAVIPPQATHHVEILGPMQMQVEFYHQPPLAGVTPA